MRSGWEVKGQNAMGDKVKEDKASLQPHSCRLPPFAKRNAYYETCEAKLTCLPQRAEINNARPPAIDSSLTTCTRKVISTSRSVTARNQISLRWLIPCLKETTVIQRAGAQVLISLGFLWCFPTPSAFCARISLHKKIWSSYIESSVF